MPLRTRGRAVEFAVSGILRVESGSAQKGSADFLKIRRKGSFHCKGKLTPLRSKQINGRSSKMAKKEASTKVPAAAAK
jgi:hypothetical protein